MSSDQIAVAAWEIIGVALVLCGLGAGALKLWFITLGHGDWSTND